MRANRMIVFACGMAACISSVGDVFVTALTKELIDEPAFINVKYIGIAWVVITLVNLIKAYSLQRYILGKKGSYTGLLLKSVIHFPFPFLETKEYNDSLQLLRDAVTQEKEYILSIESVVEAVTGVIALYVLLYDRVTVGTMVAISILLGGTTFAALLLNRHLSELMYDYWKKYVHNTRRYHYISTVLTDKDYVEEKKVYDYVSFFSAEFSKEFDIASQKNRALGKKRIQLEMATDALFFVYSAGSFLTLLMAYTSKTITMGMFISLTGYLMTLLTKISASVKTTEAIARYKSVQKEADAFFAHEEKSDDMSRKKDKNDGSLVVEDVCFRYPNGQRDILQGVSFTFKKGRKYAIVGANGCGKTTLVKIIAGLYAPGHGTVSCNGETVVLFQDFNRYSLTVRENITLSENLSEKEEYRLSQIERDAGIDRRIMTMKAGDATELTTLKEGGEELSGGEWQRMALARILWQDADIYILDEPTANLDPLEEIRIFEMYHELLKEKTVIYITHRLGFVKSVDEVIVLNGGKIEETGSHVELLQRGGLYHEMFDAQKEWYESC